MTAVSIPAGSSLSGPFASSPEDRSPRVTWNRGSGLRGAAGTCPAPPRESVAAGNRGWCGRNATGVRKARVQSQLCGPLPFALSPSKEGVPKGPRDYRGKHVSYPSCLCCIRHGNIWGEHYQWSKHIPRAGLTEPRHPSSSTEKWGHCKGSGPVAGTPQALLQKMEWMWPGQGGAHSSMAEQAQPQAWPAGRDSRTEDLCSPGSLQVAPWLRAGLAGLFPGGSWNTSKYRCSFCHRPERHAEQGRRLGSFPNPKLVQVTLPFYRWGNQGPERKWAEPQWKGPPSQSSGEPKMPNICL